MNKTRSTILSILLMSAGAAWAASHQAGAPAKEMSPSDSAAAMTDGEVRKVDTDAKKITLKHAAIKNLDMPGMTMVFQVKDPAMLAQVKTGDKVRFTAEKINGAFTVTAIEAAK